MLTILINLSIKPECLDDFVKLAKQLTFETLGKRPGCISYAFNQREDKPTEFVLYEQWKDQLSLDKHIAALIELLGPPKAGGVLPEKLVQNFANATPYYYKVIDADG